MDYLNRLKEYTDIFYSYFPAERKDRDLVVLRGHQLAESLVFRFLRDQFDNPEYADEIRMRWDSLIAIVKAVRHHNDPSEEWVWTSSIKLERARNKVVHYLEPEKSDRLISDFVNCVRSNYSDFSKVPGDDDLKKAIFILYFRLSTLLALEEFPPCTATSIVREVIAKRCQELIMQGPSAEESNT